MNGKVIKCCKETGVCCKDFAKSKKSNNLESTTDKNDKINHNSLEALYSSKIQDDYNKPISEMISYKPMYTCADNITDLTIVLAKSFLTGTRPETQPEYDKVRVTDSRWPRVGELSMITGLAAVDNYLQSFECDELLKYCVNFIKQEVDQMSTTFVYEVKFSMPTKEEPVQLSTANMYFSLRAFGAHYNDSPIEVTYSYENSNLVFRPGEVKLKESWLLNIMQSKTEFRELNDFNIDSIIFM